MATSDTARVSCCFLDLLHILFAVVVFGASVPKVLCRGADMVLMAIILIVGSGLTELEVPKRMPR